MSALLTTELQGAALEQNSVQVRQARSEAKTRRFGELASSACVESLCFAEVISTAITSTSAPPKNLTTLFLPSHMSCALGHIERGAPERLWSCAGTESPSSLPRGNGCLCCGDGPILASTTVASAQLQTNGGESRSETRFSACLNDVPCRHIQMRIRLDSCHCASRTRVHGVMKY